MSELERLVEVVNRLRDPEKGCPWDSVQTNLSIRKYLVEEVGEYLDALESGDAEGMKEELGDILLQVVLNSRIAEQEGKFSLEEVARGEADKMVRRHPHVFGESTAHTESELRSQWERIKNGEGGHEERKRSIDGVPRSMPALARAHKLLAKAQRGGYQAPNASEEAQTMVQTLMELSSENAQTLLPKLLFSLVNLCRQYDCNSEELLQEAIRKFIAEYKGE